MLTARSLRAAIRWMVPLLVIGIGIISYCFWSRARAKLLDSRVENGAALSEMPLLAGIGTYRRKITSTSVLAQQYFDQGLALLYGFDDERARRSFDAAAGVAPDCAMAYWGIALANSPHMYCPNVSSTMLAAGSQALARAQELSDNATPVEQALIDALSKQYPVPRPTDHLAVAEAYASAMRTVWSSYPDDPDVGALTAEAIIDLRPWDQWRPDGTPEPGTYETLRILDAVLGKAPQHPFALHLLIHAVEASPHPEKADIAAEQLRSFAPDLEHLLHMPSHIDVRLGRWEKAISANERAIIAEKRLQRLVPHSFSPTAYHDYHMLAFAAMMKGESMKAERACQELLAATPPTVSSELVTIVDSFSALPYEVHLRFGKWEQMLAEPPPRKSFQMSTALWRFGRSIAFTAKGEVDRAKAEQQEFAVARKAVPQKTRFRQVSADRLLAIADDMLAGEIAYREGKVNEAIAALHKAIEGEDSIGYAEPPNWLMPVRHVLGATLLDAKRYSEAEAVYREDLTRSRENGWSLYGLARSLRQQGRLAEAAAVSTRFETAWRNADVSLRSSCFCLEGKR